MRYKIISSAFMAILLFVTASIASAQSADSSISLSETVDSLGRDVVTIGYTGLENPNLRIFEALLPGPVDSCFENNDFSTAVPADPSRASLVYDHAAGMYTLKWILKRDKRDTCRVLILDDGDVDGRDFLVWQRNYGSSLSTENVSSSDTRGDGSVRNISYSISNNSWY